MTRKKTKAILLRRMKDAEQAFRYDDALAERGFKRGTDYHVLYPWDQGNGWYQFFTIPGGAEISISDRAFRAQ